MGSVILSSSGTTSCIVGTEVTAYNPTTNRRFDGWFDLSNMVTGDIIEVAVYILLDPLGSYKRYYMQVYTDAQTDNPAKYVPILPSEIGYKITFKQTATTTTAKSIPWRFYEV